MIQRASCQQYFASSRTKLGRARAHDEKYARHGCKSGRPEGQRCTYVLVDVGRQSIEFAALLPPYARAQTDNVAVPVLDGQQQTGRPKLGAHDVLRLHRINTEGGHLQR